MYDFFPFYINIQKKYFLIVGGGKIACRRLKTLLKFDVNVVLIAPDISPEIKLIQNESLKLYEQAFEEKFLDVPRDGCLRDAHMPRAQSLGKSLLRLDDLLTDDLLDEFVAPTFHSALS